MTIDHKFSAHERFLGSISNSNNSRSLSTTQKYQNSPKHFFCNTFSRLKESIGMPCCDEDYTGARFNDVIKNVRLECILNIIAVEWRNICSEKNNARLQADYAAKGEAWRQECIALQQELGALMNTLFTPGGATPADWDAVVAGKEFKLKAIFASSYPRWNWPRTVPYLNLIALAHHQFEESRIRLMNMKRYYDVALKISKRGAENLATKLSAEDMMEGIEGAVPMAVYAEEQSPATVEKQLYSTIITQLRGQRVLGRGWDANSFADTIIEQSRVDPTDEAKQRAIEIIEELAERWYDDKGHDCDSDDEWDMDEVVSPYGTCDSSAYDQFCMPRILEKVIDSHITSKDGLFFSRID